MNTSRPVYRYAYRYSPPGTGGSRA